MSLIEGTVLRIALSYLLPEDVIAQSIINLVLTGGGGPFDEDDVLDDVKDYIDDILTEWALLAADSVETTLIQVYEYDTVDDDWDEVGIRVPTIDGSLAQDMLPHGVAAFTQGRTLDPDVSGSKYWPGFTEVSQADGRWTGGVVLGIGDIAVAWVDAQVGAASGATLTPGVWSVVETNFHPFNGIVVVNALPAYQRRRKPGVGS